jgi:hypothetical protein
VNFISACWNNGYVRKLTEVAPHANIIFPCLRHSSRGKITCCIHRSNFGLPFPVTITPPGKGNTMSNFYIEDLSEFGYRELRLFQIILNAWLNNGLPDGFDPSGVRPAMNKHSGNVFLVNEEYQVAMINEKKLEIFHSLPYSGHEGFLADLTAHYSPDMLQIDDVEYIIDAANNSNIELDEIWTCFK